jgi:hypothetical protein
MTMRCCDCDRLSWGGRHGPTVVLTRQTSDCHKVIATYFRGRPWRSRKYPMDIGSLPRYRGLPDSPRVWGEQDGHGKKPSMGLRDYLALSFVIMISVPIVLGLVAHLWVCHGNAESMNSAREWQMEEEMCRGLFSAARSPAPRERPRPEKGEPGALATGACPVTGQSDMDSTKMKKG